MPPDAETEMLPLFWPHEGCVKRVETCTPVDALTVTEVTLVHAPAPEAVTVTV